ncbi:efflux RND transporter periplasmic adaptor subunit [Aquimarina sp. AD10]|uniref:Efflux transporter periplasmic adaptor subunit n=1 Tax=Aquimarina aggregata TaxID=1642818 RepID=A0A162YXL9_9FLAO|nr:MULTISPECIES: efflux RND transporter periplasmic adaptor subunit [Aquimarina]AXT61330.1 efflux RND transporter periplasmic adaptor subunit [Aquimarina sp. AD10]KZS39425.1 efflux transporter periplasmic adaptor subunit [Aquimarina aggregata]RKN01475.1 efflux RND transporter periplasmic adaptor subunit [Aquimarina sp. AD10]
MKKLLTILSILLLMISCGQNDTKSIDKIIEGGDLQALRAKRTEVVAEQQSVADKLKQLDAAIASLDSVKKLPLVTTIMAKDTLFNHYLELQGNVETKKNIVLYPEMNGILTRVYVQKGQKVTKGQLLARIDDGGLSQQLSQVEVQTQLAKTTFDRQKRLWDQKIGSEIQFLQAKTNFEAQQNAVNQIKRQLAKTTINAPFSGVIDDIITEQGNVVSVGQNAIIRIVNLDDMYIETEVPERYISSIIKGKNVEVYFPILGKTIQTKIRQVGNYINPNNRSFAVEVGIPSNGGTIKPNLTAKVKINDYTNDKAILIPQSILSENAQGDQYTYVTSTKDNKNIAQAKRVIVKTGKTQGDLIEILEGLTSGDAIISEGARSVKDGQQVKILN